MFRSLLNIYNNLEARSSHTKTHKVPLCNKIYFPSYYIPRVVRHVYLETCSTIIKNAYKSNNLRNVHKKLSLRSICYYVC